MGKSKVLIIEDETAIADLLAYSLEKESFETTTALSGSAGLYKIEKQVK
ncbi:hypothetical protein ACFFNY_23950 [Paenibacillus hodogayensis]|uniref:Response regulatory domain-containing protein n=1 Tax=Paenibacillus hodogayensis TaxID=279208 RepID=A0ABV5W240_9BACL